MKKALNFFLLLFIFCLIGCKQNVTVDYTSKINIPREISEDEILLPARAVKDEKHDIYWTSDSDVIFINNSFPKEIDGINYYITSITHQDTDVTVILTMRLEVLNKEPFEKEYTVVVTAKSESLDVISFTFLALNDFHGAVEHKNGGISVIGNYIIHEKEKDPDHTIILSSGDMFQGSAISNITQGAVVVEAMNKIGFAAMAIGNHEFDWGYEFIANYNKGKGRVKADFPFISCNIYEKETRSPVTWAEPCHVIEKSGIKIGIIGAMGSGLERSIATKFIEPFYFENPVPIVQNYARKLRCEGCKIVVLSIHADTQNMNSQYANFPPDARIDAVFNGHTHHIYAAETLDMPYIQSGSYGSHLGKIVLKYDLANDVVVDRSAENIKMSPYIFPRCSEIDDIVRRYNNEVKDVADCELGIAGKEITKDAATAWAADVIRSANKADVGFINGGGIRGGAFPVAKGTSITVGKIWEIMPFDNYVKTCLLTTEQVIRAYNGYDIRSSSNISVENDRLYIDNVLQDADKKFLTAAVDYIFDKEENVYLKGEDIRNTGVLFRDQLIEDVRNSCLNGKEWLK